MWFIQRLCFKRVVRSWPAVRLQLIRLDCGFTDISGNNYKVSSEHVAECSSESAYLLV